MYEIGLICLILILFLTVLHLLDESYPTFENIKWINDVIRKTIENPPLEQLVQLVNEADVDHNFTLTIITGCINNTGPADQTVGLFASGAGHSGAAAGQTVFLTPGDTTTNS